MWGRQSEFTQGTPIGSGTLKKIGTSARKELQSILGTKFFLELYVKVLKNWLENPQIVRQLDWHWQLERMAGEWQGLHVFWN